MQANILNYNIIFVYVCENTGVVKYICINSSEYYRLVIKTRETIWLMIFFSVCPFYVHFSRTTTMTMINGRRRRRRVITRNYVIPNDNNTGTVLCQIRLFSTGDGETRRGRLGGRTRIVVATPVKHAAEFCVSFVCAATGTATAGRVHASIDRRRRLVRYSACGRAKWRRRIGLGDPPASRSVLYSAGGGGGGYVARRIPGLGPVGAGRVSASARAQEKNRGEREKESERGGGEIK